MTPDSPAQRPIKPDAVEDGHSALEQDPGLTEVDEQPTGLPEVDPEPPAAAVGPDFAEAESSQAEQPSPVVQQSDVTSAPADNEPCPDPETKTTATAQREWKRPSNGTMTVFNAAVVVVISVITNIATGGKGWLWWALLLTLAISAIALSYLLAPADHPGAPWRSWVVLALAASSLVAAVVAVVFNIANPLPGELKRPPSVGEVLSRTVVQETDLDAPWQRQKTPLGTKSITDDEFCGATPGPRPSQQRAQVFSESRLGVTRAAIFSQSVYFQHESSAQAFMADVRRLAESCTKWPYTPAPNAKAVTVKIGSYENVDLGDDAYKVVVPGGGSETAYLYIRNGRYILSVTHDVLDLPIVTGDEQTDPAVLDELGRKVQERFEDVTG